MVKTYGYHYRSKWTFSWSRRKITVIADSDSFLWLVKRYAYGCGSKWSFLSRVKDSQGYGSSWKFSWLSRSMVTVMAVAGSSRDGQEVWLRLWQ